MLSDLSRVLRAEERSAWQRLVRVLGHEINNSLAPIKSIAGSLRSLAGRPARAPDWEQDLRLGAAGHRGPLRGAGPVHERLRPARAAARAASSGRWRWTTWVRRVAALETRLPVRVTAGPGGQRSPPTATSSTSS